MQKYEAEIDYCPRCKGVWLDRGEIDKIASKYDEDYYDDDYYNRRRRNGGFLDNLFNFD